MSTAGASRDRSGLQCLVHSVLGHERGEYLLDVLQRDQRLWAGGLETDRGTLAMALNVLLLADLLDRVPTAAAYVAQVAASGGRVCFDHGALRTIDGPCGALPRGIAAFSRILVPLGYRIAGVYPLPKLHMTGHAFVHSDQPETVPQFFVSALHVSQLPDTAQATVARVFGSSVDPLGDSEARFLATLGERGSCLVDDAARALPGLAAAFGRQHPMLTLADYETLLLHSAEAAWIATEGNAFNHAADRVDDVAGLAVRLKDAGLPLKSELEVSANGRVIQTAFIADRIEREFVASDGTVARREVPGSFFEFITRHHDPATGKIDLSFDSGNATGIFAVTGAA